MRWILSVVLALGFAAPASAGWYKVESDHFVIYADDTERNVQNFAKTLEMYHSAMEVITGRHVPVPSPSNRVTIYTMQSARDIQALAQTKSRYLQGFYLPRAGGSVAFVQELQKTGKKPDAAMELLFHEYAHHFLISSQRMAMPKWMSEGAAEFFSASEFQADGRVDLGLPNFSREYELFNADKVPIRQLLDEDLYAARSSERYDAFYGRAWLLYHYLRFAPDRQGQLDQYWLETAKGTPRLAAAEKVFGNLDVLERAIDSYARSRRWSIISALPEQTKVGAITVKPLSPGNAAMLPVIAVSKRGVTEAEAKEQLVRARDIAARYPGDPAVLAALSECEHDAGNLGEAITAADRALAIDPAAKDALVQKGLSQFELAQDADDRDAAYRAALATFDQLGRIEPDNPYPLIYTFQGYLARGEVPPQSARSGLVKAARMAPFDLNLAYQVGTLFASEGAVAAAINVLQPVAANPHGDELSAEARDLITFLGTQPEGKLVSMAAFMATRTPAIPAS